MPIKTLLMWSKVRIFAKACSGVEVLQYSKAKDNGLFDSHAAQCLAATVAEMDRRCGSSCVWHLLET